MQFVVGRWQKYNRGLRMVWEAHLIIYLDESEGEDALRKLPHIIVT